MLIQYNAKIITYQVLFIKKIKKNFINFVFNQIILFLKKILVLFETFLYMEYLNQ